MNSRSFPFGAFLAWIAVVSFAISCGDSHDAGADSAGNGGPVSVDEKLLDSWLAAFTALRHQGLEVGARLGDDPTTEQSYSAALEVSSESEAILKSHGFDPVSFEVATHAISKALAAVMLEDRQIDYTAQLEGQVASLKKLPNVTQEQIDELEASLEKSKAEIETATRGATEETKDLIRNNRHKLEAALR
jgi:hypothetical protein